MATHVGAIIASMDGSDMACRSVTPDENTGRQLRSAFSRTGRAQVVTEGVATGAIQFEVYIPLDGNEPDYRAISNGRLRVESPDGRHQETWTGVGVQSVSTPYQVEGDTVRNITGFYTDYFKG